MLKNRKSNASGFTLVELLIVIVIIAILAVLTLVGVNGYINRANDSKAKDSAGQLRTKIEAWNSIKATYPSLADVTGGLKDSTVPEAALNDSLVGLIDKTGSTTLDPNTPLRWTPCSDATKGGDILYWQKATPAGVSIHVGDAC